MNWIINAIKDYNNLSESEQAHVDAALDSLEDSQEAGVCVCGTKDCPEEYVHTTSGVNKFKLETWYDPEGEPTVEYFTSLKECSQLAPVALRKD